MDVCTTVIVRFLDGTVQEHLNVSIKDVARMYSTKRYTLGKEPLLISCPNINQQLYYDAEQLKQYIQNDIDFTALYDALWCDGLYRNVITLKAEQKNEVEPNCLWLHQKEILLLVDDDRHITTSFNNSQDFFTKIA
ncbi:MAG: hypothetical protein BM557_01380 [Flavobacterium sp. MedPE-SWcel]|uniref:hypothetical protein n=1 Tax=uncultured Flavobacterium sp. TaxID=165435 RepID=UPI0009109799|nr:hypothetical protein [uncultured Flavobacterium sp.]OIQ22058.1 MAG: hypothetical protein BM557_01380 [Flavobacterium sp. MedPE-SWcel]